MTITTTEVWVVIALLAIGTYAIRYSFLGLIGDRPLPPIVLRLLRYTPVAVIPGMVAPLVLWPAATDGRFDLPRLLAGLVTAMAGYWSRNLFIAIGAGAVTLYISLALQSAL